MKENPTLPFFATDSPTCESVYQCKTIFRDTVRRSWHLQLSSLSIHRCLLYYDQRIMNGNRHRLRGGSRCPQPSPAPHMKILYVLVLSVHVDERYEKMIAMDYEEARIPFIKKLLCQRMPCIPASILVHECIQSCHG